jgi:multidrug efflux pump subunit AcrB
MIAAITLPMAVIPTFVFMWVFGGPVNLMSLGGLAVAIGLVIDDAVVVVENIHRRAGEEGRQRRQRRAAADRAACQLDADDRRGIRTARPALGCSGQFFRALSMSLTVAVLISLALSITVVPLMARWAAAQHHKPAGEWHGRVEGVYERMLGWMVRSPALSIAVAVLLAVLTVGLFYSVGTGFFPAADEGGFVLDYLTPEGSALGETDRQVKEIEKLISETPEVASYSRRTGSELGLFATAQNTGDILVRLKPRNQRRRSSDEVIDELRDKLHEAVPLVDIEFVQLLQDMLGDLEGNPEPIEVKIFGSDPAVLAELADPVEEMLNKVRGVVDVVGVQKEIPRSRGPSIRRRPSGTGSPSRRCRISSPATGSARSPPIFVWRIAVCRFAFDCRTCIDSIRTGCRRRSSEAPRGSSFLYPKWRICCAPTVRESSSARTCG